jgi:hypothetical protein
MTAEIVEDHDHTLLIKVSTGRDRMRTYKVNLDPRLDADVTVSYSGHSASETGYFDITDGRAEPAKIVESARYAGGRWSQRTAGPERLSDYMIEALRVAMRDADVGFDRLAVPPRPDETPDDADPWHIP